MKVTVKRETNANGVYIRSFYVEERLIGEMFSTYHPTIPYEVYYKDHRWSHRVHSEEEAIEWLLTFIPNEVVK